MAYRPRYYSKKRSVSQPKTYPLGHALNPHPAPVFNANDECFKRGISVFYTQRRYRGTTNYMAYPANSVPEDYEGYLGSYGQRIDNWDWFTEQEFNHWKSAGHMRNVKIGDEFYRNPIAQLSYEEFKKNFVCFKRFDAYTD